MGIARAYSLLDVKAIDSAKREFVGMATTPTPDRIGDIVEPKGAIFKLPLPLLWQHDSHSPVGEVFAAKVKDNGIEVRARVAQFERPGRLKDMLDFAWDSIQAGLVKGLSIGFKILESARIGETWSEHILKWEWLELSPVTIAMNGEASITEIKSADHAVRNAAPGALRVVRLDRTPAGVLHVPGASGKDLAMPRKKGVVYLK
jgi:HK97 family phage prohead protease